MNIKQPYIPAAHEKYGLLPHRMESGGEVFSYPAELSAIDDWLQEYESKDAVDEDKRKVLLMPIGYQSYDEYYDMLEAYAEKYVDIDPDLSQALLLLEDAIRKMNVKEHWSIVRYIGKDRGEAVALTPGKFYYWPCSEACPEYEGVIDDDENTSYLYPCDPDSWEIAEDPTGMATRALAGEADTVDEWTSDLFSELVEKGARVKQERKNFTLNIDRAISWSDTDIDTVEITCPQCGTSFDFDAWTLVNAQQNPEAVSKIIDGSLFEFVCPSCGYDAHLAQPCLYVDPVNRVCVYSVLSEDMATQAEAMFLDPDNDAAAASICRIVFGREELAEKVLAFTNGLDDRALELLKFGIRGSARLEGFVSESDEVIARLEAVDGDTLSFSIETRDERFVADMTIGACNMFHDALEKSSIADEQPLYTSIAWGEHALDVIRDEGTMD